MKINEFGRNKSCKDLEKLTINGGEWAFVHLTPDGTDICTREELTQILKRWRDKYREFEQKVKLAH